MGIPRRPRCQLRGCRRPATVYIVMEPFERIETCRLCAMKAKQGCATVGLDLDVRELRPAPPTKLSRGFVGDPSQKA
jgi:hypothetical protein